MTTVKMVIPSVFSLSKAEADTEVGDLPFKTRLAIAMMLEDESERMDLGPDFKSIQIHDDEEQGSVAVCWIFSADTPLGKAEELCLKLRCLLVQLSTDRLLELAPTMSPENRKLLKETIAASIFPGI